MTGKQRAYLRGLANTLPALYQIGKNGLDEATVKTLDEALEAKELIKVSKANPLAEYVGKCPDTIVCAIYEDAFDRLDERTKRLLLTDAFGVVFYDDEKDKISIGAPQIVVTVAGRMKYGEDLINAAETGVLAIQQVEDEKREQKELEKANKKNKD